MKAFNRDSLQQYKTIPRVNNNPYQSYYNPNTSAYAPVQQQQSFEGLLQGIPQGMMETYEDLMENTLPSEFRNLSQDQIFQKLNEAYSYNQTDPLSEVKTTMDQKYNGIRNDLENQYQARVQAANYARQQQNAFTPAQLAAQARYKAFYSSNFEANTRPVIQSWLNGGYRNRWTGDSTGRQLMTSWYPELDNIIWAFNWKPTQ